MKMFVRSFLYLSITLLSACTSVGPQYHRAEDAVVRRNKVQHGFVNHLAHKDIFSDKSPAKKWWTTYSNVELNKIVDRVLDTNPSIQVALENLTNAQALLGYEQSTQGLRVDVSGDTVYGHPSGVEELRPTVRPPSEWMYSSKIHVAYLLDIWGFEEKRLDLRKSKIVSESAHLKQIQSLAVANAVSAYADYCQNKQIIQWQKQQLNVHEEGLKLLKRYIDAGKKAAPESLPKQQGLYSLQASIPVTLSKQNKALYYLAALMGRAPQELLDDEFSCRGHFNLNAEMDIGDPNEFFTQRPDIIMAEEEAIAATTEVGISMQSLYPSIQIGFLGGSSGPMNLLGGKGTWSWSLGPMISWSIPNRVEAERKVAAANATARAKIKHFDEVVLTALRETENNFEDYRALNAQLEKAKQALNTAELSLKQQELLFAKGKTNKFQVLDAKSNVLSERLRYETIFHQTLLSQIAIFLSLGV